MEIGGFYPSTVMPSMTGVALGKHPHLRCPIRNKVEHSAKKIWAQCSTLWPLVQYLCSIIQPNYHLSLNVSTPQGVCPCPDVYLAKKFSVSIILWGGALFSYF